jgi:hypothetical protein
VSHPTVAVAVIRDNPPGVLVAEDFAVLHRALAVRLVARADRRIFSPELLAQLQQALLEEKWSDAVAMWIKSTGTPIDVYTEDVFTTADFPPALLGVQMQFSPLFAEPEQ